MNALQAAAAGFCLALGVMTLAGPVHPPAIECKATWHDGHAVVYPAERIRITNDGWLYATQSEQPLYGWQTVECGP